MDLLEILNMDVEDLCKYFKIDSRKVSDETLEKIAENAFSLRYNLLVAMDEEFEQFGGIQMEENHD